MLLPRPVVATFSIGMMVLGAGVASGQNYPNKPIRIVTSEAGGNSDFVARIIALGLSANLGQQAIVDNRASGVIPGAIVSKAPPDGYTLLGYGGTFWLGALLQKTPYDPVRDFSPITLVVRSPNVLVVNPALPVNTVKDLIALAKTKPGALNYGSAAVGSSPHLAAELFKHMAGVNIVFVPYKGTAQGLNDLLSGQVQLMFAPGSTVTPHIKSGRLRALAVTSAQPTALFPGLPTIDASGVPGYESVSMFGIFAPAKTPAAIINKLNQESVRVLDMPGVRDRFYNVGLEAVGSSPQEFAAIMKSEMTRMGAVIQHAGIRAE